ncbi:hypothetical protein [Citricoccus sp. NR2]|uniref:hypothetical protein n=1 Tax=Citricoccus sp. NR2 TaxID=3004095 RepID=UPI0022DDBA3F|nr:hypothetical protein [Citricoccus sp. NR2]WBL18471.1 hypothetical protein O1A05_11985 [Citricoccus sp. NR2]
MDELAKLIDDAMTEKGIGVNALNRAAERAGLKLSASTISLYRRGAFPKSVPAETLHAFSVLLDIPERDLHRAAYGTGGPTATAERATLAESLGKLSPRHRKLVSQLIHELNRTQEDPNESEPQESREDYGLAAHTRKPGDPDPDQAPDY